MNNRVLFKLQGTFVLIVIEFVDMQQLNIQVWLAGGVKPQSSMMLTTRGCGRSLIITLTLDFRPPISVCLVDSPRLVLCSSQSRVGKPILWDYWRGVPLW